MPKKVRKIMLTGVGGDVACAIIRCIQDGFKNDEIYGMDIKEYTPYMNRIKKSITAPRYTESGYVSFLKRSIMENEITHFLPTTEAEILIAAENRRFFMDNGIKLLINNDIIIKTCTSKYQTAKFLKDAGIDVPLTYLADEYKGELSYPFIVKADSGSGGKKLKLIQNERQWDKVEKEHMVCQQLIGDADHEYTVGIFSDGTQVRTIVLKRYLGLGGMSIQVCCCENPDIQNIAKKIAKAYDLHGCINVQLRKQEDIYYVFEINPRLSSTAGFRHKMGFQDVIWWFMLMDGENIPNYKNDSVGMVGVKLTDDVILTKIGGGGG